MRIGLREMSEQHVIFAIEQQRNVRCERQFVAIGDEGGEAVLLHEIVESGAIVDSEGGWDEHGSVRIQWVVDLPDAPECFLSRVFQINRRLLANSANH